MADVNKNINIKVDWSDPKNSAQKTDQLKGGMSGLVDTAKKNEQAFKKLTGTIKALFGAAIIGVAVAGAKKIITALAGFTKRAGEIEQTKIALETFTGSAKKANAVLKELNKFSAVTPFTETQVQSAGKALLAFGITAENLIPTLKRVGDLSAGTGKDFNELAVIFGKAKTQGVLFAEDINQLTEAGIPIIGEFAKMLGVSEGQVKKLGSEGKITFDLLDQAFTSLTSEGGRFFDLTAKQSKSFLGLWSTAVSLVDRLKANIGAKLIPILTPFLQKTIEILDTTSDLERTTIQLTAANDNYLEVVKKLKNPLKDLNEEERKRLETQRMLFGAERTAALLDLNDIYIKLEKTLKKQTQVTQWANDASGKYANTIRLNSQDFIDYVDEVQYFIESINKQVKAEERISTEVATTTKGRKAALKTIKDLIKTYGDQLVSIDLLNESIRGANLYQGEYNRQLRFQQTQTKKTKDEETALQAVEDKKAEIINTVIALTKDRIKTEEDLYIIQEEFSFLDERLKKGIRERIIENLKLVQTEKAATEATEQQRKDALAAENIILEIKRRNEAEINALRTEAVAAGLLTAQQAVKTEKEKLKELLYEYKKYVNDVRTEDEKLQDSLDAQLDAIDAKNEATGAGLIKLGGRAQQVGNLIGGELGGAISSLGSTASGVGKIISGDLFGGILEIAGPVLDVITRIVTGIKSIDKAVSKSAKDLAELTVEIEIQRLQEIDLIRAENRVKELELEKEAALEKIKIESDYQKYLDEKEKERVSKLRGDALEEYLLKKDLDDKLAEAERKYNEEITAAKSAQFEIEKSIKLKQNEIARVSAIGALDIPKTIGKGKKKKTNPDYTAAVAELNTLYGELSGLISSQTPTRARGGNIDSARGAIVGEQGAELFIPNKPGSIIPANATAKLVPILDQIARMGKSGGSTFAGAAGGGNITNNWNGAIFQLKSDNGKAILDELREIAENTGANILSRS